MLTKKTLMATAAQVAAKAPHATNSTLRLVDRRHPRGLAGRTLRAAGLTPAQIGEIQAGNTLPYLNDAATRYINTLNLNALTTTWAKAVKATNSR